MLIAVSIHCGDTDVILNTLHLPTAHLYTLVTPPPPHTHTHTHSHHSQNEHQLPRRYPTKNHLHAQFKRVSTCSGKPTCAVPCLSVWHLKNISITHVCKKLQSRQPLSDKVQRPGWKRNISTTAKCKVKHQLCSSMSGFQNLWSQSKQQHFNPLGFETTWLLWWTVNPVARVWPLDRTG